MLDGQPRADAATRWTVLSHIVPVNEDGTVRDGHELSADCPCEPEYRVSQATGAVWRHHHKTEPERA